MFSEPPGCLPSWNARGQPTEREDPKAGFLIVACHEDGTTVSGFLPVSWDHLVASYGTTRRALQVGSSVRLFDAHVVSQDVEVNSDGVQGGRDG